VHAQASTLRARQRSGASSGETRSLWSAIRRWVAHYPIPRDGLSSPDYLGFPEYHAHTLILEAIADGDVASRA
jgi:hypothetical protein